VTGTFNDSRSASTSGRSALPIFEDFYASDSASAATTQNTSISNTLFQGTGTSSTSSTLNPDPTQPDNTVQANGSTTFSVSFTVSTPATFTLSGTLTGSSSGYDEGFLGVSNDNAELTSTAQLNPLYQATEDLAITEADLAPFSESTPFSFSTTLLPGPTYTLSVSAISQAEAELTNTRTDSSSAGFNFTATAVDVPEPSSLGIFALAGLLPRRWRRGS
jgi:hypothetical protein